MTGRHAHHNKWTDEKSEKTEPSLMDVAADKLWKGTENIWLKNKEMVYIKKNIAG